MLRQTGDRTMQVVRSEIADGLWKKAEQRTAKQRARNRLHYIANRDGEIAAAKQRNRLNPHWNKRYRLAQGGKTAARDMVKGARTRAKNHGVPFDPAHVTVDRLYLRLLGEPNCACCGVEFDLSRTGASKGGPRERSPTLDRIVGERGYVPGNVAILCWPCNKLKGGSDVLRLRKLLAWLESIGISAA